MIYLSRISNRKLSNKMKKEIFLKNIDTSLCLSSDLRAICYKIFYEFANFMIRKKFIIRKTNNVTIKFGYSFKHFFFFQTASYFGQRIRKCVSSSTEFVVHIVQILCSRGIFIWRLFFLFLQGKYRIAFSK